MASKQPHAQKQDQPLKEHGDKLNPMPQADAHRPEDQQAHLESGDMPEEEKQRQIDRDPDRQPLSDRTQQRVTPGNEGE